MTGRFQIQKTLQENSEGVVLSALDLQTKALVEMKRFFPFGKGGGGLDEHGTANFQLVMEKIAPVKHIALRAILTSGVDPLDKIPYIVIERVEGTPLQAFIENAPLSSEEAIYLITQALDVSELLSQALGFESIWVETGLSSIIVATPEASRGYTFCISPGKCLSKNQGERGLESIVSLVEEVMGWSGMAVSDEDGGGLGTWLKWLRLSTTGASLSQARQKLGDLVGSMTFVPSVPLPVPLSFPPSHAPSYRPAPALVRRAMGRLPIRRGESRSLPIRRSVRQSYDRPGPIIFTEKFQIPGFVKVLAGLGAFAVAAYMLILWHESRLLTPKELVERLSDDDRQKTTVAQIEPETTEIEPAAPKPVAVKRSPIVEREVITDTEELLKIPVKRVETPEEKASRIAVEFSDITAGQSSAADQKAAIQQASVIEKKGIFTVADSELLATQHGTVISLEGTLMDISKSSTGKTMYLLFSKAADSNDVRGSIRTANVGSDLSEESLRPLVGKNLTIRGKIDVDTFRGLNRPLILIENRDSIIVK